MKREDMTRDGAFRLLEEAVALLWRCWKTSYDGHDDQLGTDIDNFLYSWPIESMPEGLEDYVTALNPVWPLDEG